MLFYGFGKQRKPKSPNNENEVSTTSVFMNKITIAFFVIILCLDSFYVLRLAGHRKTYITDPFVLYLYDLQTGVSHDGVTYREF